MMNNLPQDLWACVAAMLGHEEVARLERVCRATRAAMMGRTAEKIVWARMPRPNRAHEFAGESMSRAAMQLVRIGLAAGEDMRGWAEVAVVRAPGAARDMEAALLGCGGEEHVRMARTMYSPDRDEDTDRGVWFWMYSGVCRHAAGDERAVGPQCYTEAVNSYGKRCQNVGAALASDHARVRRVVEGARAVARAYGEPLVVAHSYYRETTCVGMGVCEEDCVSLSVAVGFGDVALCCEFTEHF